MVDQATELRNLVLRSRHAVEDDLRLSPRLLVIGGGGSGVGVTTLAVNLAVALSERGARTVLVDADLYRPDVAELCGLHPQGTVGDVLAARADICDVLQSGPRGIQVIPGAQTPAASADYTESAQGRLLRQLRTLAGRADIVLLDSGNSGSEVVRRFWQAADEILLVTTPDSVAVMDCYATLKRLAAADDELSIQLIVNRSPDGATAEDVHRRIDSSCRRFLGLGVGLLGHVPPDASFETGAGAGTSIVTSSLAGDKTPALDSVVAQLMVRTKASAASDKRKSQRQDKPHKAIESAQPRPALSPIVK